MIVCSKCGYENQLGHIFCTHCRAKLDFNGLSEKELIKSKKSSGRKGLRVMLFLVLLIVMAMALALWPLPVQMKRGTLVDLQQARRKIALMKQCGNIPPQVFSESELNACLAATLKTHRRPDTFLIQSIRMKVKPNAVVLSVMSLWRPRSAGGVRMGPFQITYGIIGVPEIGDRGFHFAVSRSMIGHLPLPGPLGLMLAPRIKTYFRELRQDHPIVDAFRQLELENGKITVYLRK